MFSDKAFIELVHSTVGSQIEELNIAGCAQLTSAGFYRSKEMTDGIVLPNLQKFDVRECVQISSTALEKLLVTRLPNSISHINLSRCTQIPTNSMQKIIRHHSIALQRLELSQCLQIDDKVAESLAFWCPNMEDLYLDDCFNITGRSLGFLEKVM